MNILYLEHYAGSPEMGMEFRPYYLSREWVKMGHKVTIIAGDYSHLRKKNPIVTRDFQSEDIDGIEYVWVKTGSYEGNGVARALTMERFVRKLYTCSRMIAQRWKPDIVIASSTYPLDTWPAQKISKIAQCKYIHEVHDLWPATLYEVGGMSKKHPFVVAMQIAENSAYKHCDLCVSLTPYSKGYMVQHGLEPEKWVNVQNGIVEEEWDNPDPLPEEHQKFFEEHKDKFIVGYFGGHALSNALDNLLDAAKMITDPGIIFVLVGNGVKKENLIKRKQDESIDNVFFLPPIKKSVVPTLTKQFDVSIMTGVPSPLYKYGLCMNKMYDSMMAGKPIICAISAPKTLVDEYNCGEQISDVSPFEIAKSVERFARMSEGDRQKIGINGRNAVKKNYTYKKLAECFIQRIDK
ncbi:glycosyltransferase WbuB [Butyrivibrio sp. CB08]|uniref:glycosyltransferase family 4 protein n=1 Tax=Butyrivibrio sp. CB08 TaxID=2364879 RepID=UPI000EA9A0EF|nr:glycosyltransferase family 4 protein [Butyrivibrio sp. CB08]RKM57897.1 glycosyltransferase WbuB [Butyrivibrio sp. CB08]